MADDRYKKSRMVAFVRDGFKCQHPGCTVRRLNLLTAHHLLPRAEGGRSVPENLATLCEEHHTALHQDPEAVARFRKEWQARLKAEARPVRRNAARVAEEGRGVLRLNEVTL